MDIIIKTLNKFLKGIHMGITGFNRFIDKLPPSNVKETFISIRDDQTKHATLIAERIRELGGTPVEDEGVFGKITGTLSSTFKSLNTEEKIIKEAIKGENIYGIRMSEEIVRDKLDEESLKLVRLILDQDRDHVDRLKSLLHS